MSLKDEELHLLRYNSSFIIQGVCVCVHVQAGSHVRFGADAAQSPAKDEECALTVSLCVCICVCLVRRNSADACCGWALRRCRVVSHLDEHQSSAWSWYIPNLKRWIDWWIFLMLSWIFFSWENSWTYIAATCVQIKPCVCLCSLPTCVSSLLGVCTESQCFISHVCQKRVFFVLRWWELHVPAGDDKIVYLHVRFFVCVSQKHSLVSCNYHAELSVSRKKAQNAYEEGEREEWQTYGLVMSISHCV